MMLRSLVKKFKSHSINEDSSPTDQQQHSPNSPLNLVDGIQSAVDYVNDESIQTDQSPNFDSNATSNSTSIATTTPAAKHEIGTSNRQQIGSNTQDIRGNTTMQMPRHHHHLRGCTCGGSGGNGGGADSVSSIATRLRSSVTAASNQNNNGTAVAMEQHRQQQQMHRRHLNFCPQHRRGSMSGNGNRYYYQGAMSKPIGSDGVTLDDDFCKDSGTESDDEELEQIETNSTHSVPVSQTSDYYASQQSLSINSCRSSHCSSPLFGGLSDQECNSWESIGSESGISVRGGGANAMMTGSRHRQRHQHHHQQQQKCHQQSGCNRGGFTAKSNIITTNYPLFKFDTSTIGFGTMTSTMPMETMTEELPQHHYHTRQQFQRLTQQISMKNGLISANDFDDTTATTTVGSSINERNVVEIGLFRPTAPFGVNVGGHGHGNSMGTITELGEMVTAFVPVRRSAATVSLSGLPSAEQSPDGGGNSSLDELEELNFNGQQAKMITRRSRSSTISALGTSEKRKWSQMRHESKKQTSPEEEPKLKDRPVLHAARKTPIKLLFSLDGKGLTSAAVASEIGPSEDGMRDEIDQKSLNTKNRYQLPQNGHVSPPAGNLAKKSKSSLKKKCKDDEVKAGGASELNRCLKDDVADIDHDDESGRSAKRPSLDFNKMRGKMVGIGIISSRNKNTKRSTSLISCSGMKAKLKNFGRRESYQLRSSRRVDEVLFRPLEPPTTVAAASSSVSESGIIENQTSAWFPSQLQFGQQQQQGLNNGTFYFGSHEN